MRSPTANLVASPHKLLCGEGGTNSLVYKRITYNQALRHVINLIKKIKPTQT